MVKTNNQTKVENDDLPLMADNYVRGFKISMNNVEPMQLGNTRHQLGKGTSEPRFIQHAVRAYEGQEVDVSVTYKATRRKPRTQ